MTIPGLIDMKGAHHKLVVWLKRMDQEKPEFKGPFLTLTERESKSLEARLTHKELTTRMADRAILLGVSVSQGSQTK